MEAPFYYYKICLFFLGWDNPGSPCSFLLHAVHYFSVMLCLLAALFQGYPALPGQWAFSLFFKSSHVLLFSLTISVPCYMQCDPLAMVLYILLEPTPLKKDGFNQSDAGRFWRFRFCFFLSYGFPIWLWTCNYIPEPLSSPRKGAGRW